MSIRRRGSFWPAVAMLLVLLGAVLTPSSADACDAKKKFDIPFEILVAAKSNALVPLIALDVINARETDHGNVKADLSANLTLEVQACPELPAVAPRPVRYPLGIVLRNVTFPLELPEEFMLPHEGDIIAN